MLCFNIGDIIVIFIEGVDYRCIIHDISKCKAINLFEKFCAWWLWVYIKCISMKSILTTKSSAVTLKIWSEQKNWWEKLLELGDLFY